jgi:hypothetical protein
LNWRFALCYNRITPQIAPAEVRLMQIAKGIQEKHPVSHSNSHGLENVAASAGALSQPDIEEK